MKVFKNRDAQFPIAIQFNDSTQKLTLKAADELARELIKNIHNRTNLKENGVPLSIPEESLECCVAPIDCSLPPNPYEVTEWKE